ncbi:MAG: carboxypeptidase-like regulatory domain-containing protein [Dehalococcoidales bacterium]|nr:carboxypeptidase-like regulatory domain-containing protein [Dehalococcoidales bacterium]
MSAKRHSIIVVLMTTAIALVAMLALGASAVGAAAQGTAEITAPAVNAQVSGMVVVSGTATATDFQFYKLEFTMGGSPGQWSVIGSLHETQVANGTLGTWDVSALPAGAYMLRLTVVDNTGNYSDYSVPVTVGSPGSRPTQPTVARPTATSTWSAQPTTDLVLVPMAVRPAVAPPGSPSDRGIIRGRVLEASGRGVYGQVVKVTRGGFRQTATTAGDGSYEIAGLEPGTYSVVVERQICTPAEGLNLPAGQALQVDFVQIPPPSPTASPTASPTGTRQPSPGVATTPTRTPTPLPLTTTVSPTPTPHSAFVDPLDVSRWWDWLGLDLDLDWIASYLYLGIAGGFLVFVLGLVITLVRK